MKTDRTKMKVLVTGAALLGAVSLMGWIIVAQAGYQQSWSENAQQRMPGMAVNEAISAAPAWLHQLCVNMK